MRRRKENAYLFSILSSYSDQYLSTFIYLRKTFQVTYFSFEHIHIHKHTHTHTHTHTHIYIYIYIYIYSI